MSNDLLRRTLTGLSSRDDFPDPVTVVRRRIRRRQARVRATAAAGALVLLTGGTLALQRIDVSGDDHVTTVPTGTPSPASSPAPSGPTVRSLPVDFRKAIRRIVTSHPWGHGPGEWGTSAGGEEALVGPSDLLADAHGRLYVVDGINRRVLAYDAGTGAPLPQWSTRIPSGYYGAAAVDPVTGDLYVANHVTSDNGAEIERISNGRLAARIPVNLSGVGAGTQIFAHDGTVEAEAGAAGDRPARTTLVAHNATVADPATDWIVPSLETPAVQVGDGRLTVQFGAASSLRVDFGEPVDSVAEEHVASPGVVWMLVGTRSAHRWIVRVTSDGATAMAVERGAPFDNDAGLAATAAGAYFLAGDDAQGWIAAYRFGAPLKR
ncbi:MAG: hypothetical protein ACJ74O_10490 [Frankiaceae bacterium]